MLVLFLTACIYPDRVTAVISSIVMFFITTHNNIVPILIIEPYYNSQIREHVPKALVILVGLKSDLRTKSENESRQIRKRENSDCLVVTADVKALSQEVGAVCYLECSALNNERINDVFKKAVKACRHSWKQKCAML